MFYFDYIWLLKIQDNFYKKEFYLNEGVKEIEKLGGSRKFKTYVVPSKFKDDENAIEEIKELFRIYKVDFYEL